MNRAPAFFVVCQPGGVIQQGFFGAAGQWRVILIGDK